MPASLSIKNVPDHLMQRLREQASRNHRSLQGEVLAILEGTVGPKTLSLDEVRARIRDLNFKTGDDSTHWIREDRDAR
jgi:antitoxin FitA